MKFYRQSDDQRGYTFIANKRSKDPMDATHVVMVITLSADAAGTRAAEPFDPLLIIYLNPHPRPSFISSWSAGHEALSGGLVERFGFSRADADDLARQIREARQW